MVASVHSRTLRKAAELLGGVSKLSRRLRVPSSELIEWMDDKAEPPGWVFLKAVDILLEETLPPAESEPPDPAAPRDSAPGEGHTGTWR